MRVFILILCSFTKALLAVPPGGISSEPCTSASLSTGGRSLIAESRTKVTVESDGEEDCSVNLRLILVGGGGDGDAFSGNGGGSGNVEFKQLRFFKITVGAGTILSLDVGGDGNFGGSGGESTVSEYPGGATLAQAGGGGGGGDSEVAGGAGYSGGGGGSITGYPGGAGGSDGGDGEHSPFSSDGGAGSGLDISTMELEHFKLVPGRGGVGEYNRAGGGGGVLVEDGGKVRGRSVQDSPTDGEGFGAGSGNGWAAKGVIIMEIVQ